MNQYEHLPVGKYIIAAIIALAAILLIYFKLN